MNAAMLSSHRPVLVRRHTLHRAVKQVRRELRQLGLWDQRLARIVVKHAWAGYAYGWQWYGTSGDICIPALSVCRISDWWAGEYKSIADVLRHEYGHALADTHRGFFRSRQFSEAFGAAHSNEQEQEYDERCHVTEYASTNASEDFAEVFMLYVRHQGRLPRQHRTIAKRAKWRFVRKLCGLVRIRSSIVESRKRYQ